MPPTSLDPPEPHETNPTPALGWSLGLRASTPASVIDSVKEGFSMEVVDRIHRHLNLSDEDMATIVGTSLRTLARRRTAGRLTSGESDRLYRLARLFERAVDVFGGDELTEEEAQQWFHTPQWALGGDTPLSYARTEPGTHEVEALLNRINYGVLA